MESIIIPNPIIVLYNEIDLSAIYKFFESADQKIFKENISKDKFLKTIKMLLISECKLNGLDFSHFPHFPIVAKSNTTGYYSILGFALIATPFDRIPKFLKFQYENYKGKDNFFNLLEIKVCEIIRHSNPFQNNDTLLKTINEWLSATKKSKPKPIVGFAWKIKEYKQKELSRRIYSKEGFIAKNVQKSL